MPRLRSANTPNIIIHSKIIVIMENGRIFGLLIGLAIVLVYSFIKGFIQSRMAEKTVVPEEGEVSFRPFLKPLFLCAFGLLSILGGGFCFYYGGPSGEIIIILSGLFMLAWGGMFLVWSASFLGNRISISKEELCIQRAAENSDGLRVFFHLGKYPLRLAWSEIKSIRKETNKLIVVTADAKEYMYPIDWCSVKAWATIVKLHPELITSVK